MSDLEVTMMKRIGELNEEVKLIKAEVERMRAVSFVTAVPSEEYEKLKAQVEQLIKAGDAMAYRVDDIIGVSKEYAQQMLADWNAAKEDSSR